MKYIASTPEEYIAQIPEERREVMEKLRKVIAENLPEGFEEGITYDMIGFYVPHSIYPDGYHCDPKHSKRKLDMGKSCIRFKKIDQIPYDLIGELCRKLTVSEWIEIYEKGVKRK